MECKFCRRVEVLRNLLEAQKKFRDEAKIHVENLITCYEHSDEYADALVWWEKQKSRR